MCDAVIRLVVIRTRPKGGKPYRYFCVFTTDLTLEISCILSSEMAIDFGTLDSIAIKPNRQSINRFVQLSFVAASVTKGPQNQKGVSVETVCERDSLVSKGLRVAYLELMTNLFSV